MDKNSSGSKDSGRQALESSAQKMDITKNEVSNIQDGKQFIKNLTGNQDKSSSGDQLEMLFTSTPKDKTQKKLAKTAGKPLKKAGVMLTDKNATNKGLNRKRKEEIVEAAQYHPYLKVQQALPSKTKSVKKVSTSIDDSKGMSILLHLKEVNKFMKSLELHSLKYWNEIQNKISDSEIQENEKTINWKSNANFSFECKALGDKNISVSGDVRQVTIQKQEIACDVESGDVKLTFNDKISISTQRSHIDCNVRKNQIIFTFSDTSITPTDNSSKDPYTAEHSEDNDSAVLKERM